MTYIVSGSVKLYSLCAKKQVKLFIITCHKLVATSFSIHSKVYHHGL